MRRYGLQTKREAVDFALRTVAGEAKPRDMLDLRWSPPLNPLPGSAAEGRPGDLPGALQDRPIVAHERTPRSSAMAT